MILLFACNKQQGWIIDGTIADGAGRKVALEGFNNGYWYVIDSLTVGDDGAFAYKAPAPAPYPDIMRLTLDGASIYFPIDSIDHVSVTATADFSSDYTLSGTPLAESIHAIDALIAERAAAVGEAALSADSVLKTSLANIIVADTTAIAGYYIVNKSVGGRPLYDLTTRRDLRVFGAVAQRFTMSRPDDPRTAYLSKVYLTARAKTSPAAAQQETVVEVPQAGLIDIVRYDSRGARHSLAEEAAKGGVVILSFTDYGLDRSPAYNVILNTVYEKYRAQGLQIYQLAFDQDEVSWKQTARNLPWITVWNATTDGAQVLLDYNIGDLPTTYIIDRTGSIAERVNDPTQIAAAVARHI